MKLYIDYDEKWLLSKTAFLIYKDCIYKPTYDEYVCKMKEYISNTNIKVYCCKNYDEYVAVMVVKYSNSIAEIIGISVADENRRHGIGKYMIDYIIKNVNADFIIAQTDDEAVGFYSKCGFTVEKEILGYPDGESVRYNCKIKV